jgi:hypothetical protein
MTVTPCRGIRLTKWEAVPGKGLCLARRCWKLYSKRLAISFYCLRGGQTEPPESDDRVVQLMSLQPHLFTNRELALAVDEVKFKYRFFRGHYSRPVKNGSLSSLLAANNEFCMLEGDLQDPGVVNIEHRYHPKSVGNTRARLVQAQDIRIETSRDSELSLKFLEFLRKVQLVIRAGEVMENAVKFSSLRGPLCREREYLADLETFI